MKKVILFCGLGLFLFSFTSCKKDWNCDCTVSSILVEININGATKGDATEICDETQTTYQSGDPNATCTLTSQ